MALFTALLIGLQVAVAEPLVPRANITGLVYIIRHGEKTSPVGCLNDVGQERAASLPSVFNGKQSPKHDTFQTPGALFANQYDSPFECERCKQTLTPISQALSEDIIFKYGYPTKIGGNAAAADAILNTSLTTPVILVAWEHINIQYLAADLGVKKADIPVWSGSDYDSVYELGFTGRVLQYFNRSAQHFAPSN